MKGLLKGFWWPFRLLKPVKYSWSYGPNEVCNTLELDKVKKSKLIYDLIGFGLMNKAQNYFIVHYQDRSITEVTTYDRMQNHERAI